MRSRTRAGRSPAREPAYGAGSWLADTASTGHLVPDRDLRSGPRARLHAERVARRRGHPRRGDGSTRRRRRSCSRRMPSRLECLDALRVLATTCAGVTAGRALPDRHRHGRRPGHRRGDGGTLGALGRDVVDRRVGPRRPSGRRSAGAGGRRDARGRRRSSSSPRSSSARARPGGRPARQGARYLTVPGLTLDDAATAAARSRPTSTRVGDRARRLAERLDAATEFRLTQRRRHRPAAAASTAAAGRPLWGIADRPGGYAAPPGHRGRREPGRGDRRGRGRRRRLAPLPRPGSARRARSSSASRPGRLVDVAGAEAWRLTDALERSGDERMTNLAEVSIGLNPCSRPGGSALELEGIVGGAHVALGNNVAYGGSVDARSHIDCVLLGATLALDGEPLDPR